MTTKEKILEEYKLKFNEVLNRMYSLEIIPDIQSLINERIPMLGGFKLFINDELESFISKALDQVAEETRKETLADVVILIDRYAKENSEEVSSPDEVLEPAKR
jgi:hypothetical protein